MPSPIEMSGQPLVDLRLLRVFLAVSEGGNMTSAAQKLGLTQSAISQGIRQLENDLQVTLIARDHRPLLLTSAGNALRHRAAKLIDDANQLPRLLQELGRSKLLEIRLGVLDSFSATVGPALIKELLPSTYHLCMWSGLSNSHSASLLQRELDLIVTSDPMDDVDGLDRYLLMREPFILLVPTNLSSKVKDYRLDKLACDYPMIRYSGRSQTGKQVDRYLRRLGINAPRVVEIDASDTLVAMVAAGLGWAMTTPLCLLQGRAHISNVTALKLPAPGLNRMLVLLSRTGEYENLPMQVATFARRLLKSLEQNEIHQMIPWLSDEVIVSGTK
jgi:DNA-binding transcriptional LysR family regulator